MSLKTVTARTMPEALARIRRELGPDAVILQARTLRQGGWLGIGRRQVVEITARMDDLPAPAPPAARVVTQTPQPGELIRRTYAGADHGDANPKPGRHADVGAPLTQELRQVRQMVEKLMHHQQRAVTSAGSNWPGALGDLHQALLDQDVASDLAETILQQVQQQLESADQASAEQVRAAARNVMARLIRVEDQTGSQNEAGQSARPQVMALIGPTGVGKTTTIAKLAAIYKLKRNLNVGLITLDTYRIAAVDQLRTYADIMGLPLHVVLDAEQLPQALDRTGDCDVVLIDTAGRSQRDDPKLEQLRWFLDAAKPDHVHLVLSATSSQRVMSQAAGRFAGVRADRLIFTKLDEAVSYGPLLNVAHQIDTPISYLTTGQEVPHEIEPADAGRIADLLLEQA